MKRTELLACALGIIVGGAVANLFLQLQQPDFHLHTSTHPIADPTDGEYHVHADFLIYIGDEQVDLSDDQYMTTASQHLSDTVHLHDNNGDVEHIHAEDQTFASFLSSIGFTLTDSCLTLDTDTTYCSDETEEVLLYVNNELYTDPISTYVPVDDDRILLYYGDATNPAIASYLDAVPYDSCYYSGTCPERGTAPPESCGLTCEL